MSKRKGISAEEKKHRILQLFQEKGEFFKLKELEKLAPKEKGINVNVVKDTLMKLVDDGLVQQRKIGNSVFFWAFSNQKINEKKRKLEEIEENLETNRKKLKLAEETIQLNDAYKENNENIDELVKEIEKNQEIKENLTKKLKQQKDTNPELIEQIKNDCELLKEVCNRWTDNIFAIKTWCKRKFLMEDKVLNKQFHISDDLDYVD